MLGGVEVFTLYEQMPKLSGFLSSHADSEEWQVSIKSLCEGQTILGSIELIPPPHDVSLYLLYPPCIFCIFPHMMYLLAEPRQ